MDTPVTTEYALEKLRDALANGETEEVKKWDLCIRSNNDMRIRAKHKQREMDELRRKAIQRQQYKRNY